MIVVEAVVGILHRCTSQTQAMHTCPHSWRLELCIELLLAEAKCLAQALTSFSGSAESLSLVKAKVSILNTLASIWEISEGSSQLQTSLWDQMVPLFWSFFSLPNPYFLIFFRSYSQVSTNHCLKFYSQGNGPKTVITQLYKLAFFLIYFRYYFYFHWGIKYFRHSWKHFLPIISRVICNLQLSVCNSHEHFCILAYICESTNIV